MDTAQLLADFFKAIRTDPRINTAHIGLYISIVHYWHTHQSVNPIRAFSRELKELAKISGNHTYHKCMRDLHDGGHIRYEASYNRHLGSRIYLKI
ncbi:hypothetical protein [Pedobacter paludis]|uniref:Transcriptional regulator n=1 Tax=Pedobacter paludis TaxID=2203212 RepID=A0A317F2W4_9SPHI|nr:hypothetical protein [Pedobacter paludis]PWS32179.1 hypothetical protein DF947_10440 [Pedobacter paludis]